jgi:hypothetical protein
MRARLVVGLDDDVFEPNLDPKLAREPLHGMDGMQAVATVEAANDGDVSVLPSIGTPWFLDHASLAKRHRVSVC